VAEVIAADGAVIVDRLAPALLMDSIGDELGPWLARTPVGPDGFAGRRTRRTGALIARSASVRELVMHPLALGTTALVLAHAAKFQLHLTQSIAIDPGESQQPLHRDQWAFDFFPFPDGYEVQCNVIWAQTDFTEENGATRVVPGSNHAEDGLVFADSDTCPAAMERGSALFYSGRVYHGGGSNRTGSTRLGVNITYNVAWLRQEENQYLSVPQEVARTLPVELLRLMGYDRGAYALGYIDDLRDPIDAIRPGTGSVGFGSGDAAVAPPATPGSGRTDPGATGPGEPASVPAELSPATPNDHDELFAAYTQIVDAGAGFPHESPLSRQAFDEYWVDHPSAVWVARVDGELAGAYYVKPNFVGKAAHIANAGYFVVESHRGRGLGQALVQHSLGEAHRLGFDAMQFNLVFASNPARRMYRRLGFQEVGRIPAAVDGEDAVIYWRSLEVPYTSMADQ
jgi:GNAT superfamily N-acetyltransferase